ncbi:MAG: hypothetical protein IAI48_00375 [Candidatus Eremiobacteraeota bacterium]|nr:hypothetical protein [Candidatus Eremiobacteraeota bacterium]
MSTFPGGPAIDTQHTYIGERVPAVPGPPVTQIIFQGTRTSLSSTSRFDLGDGGGMIAASEFVWVDLSAYNGFIDVRINDVIREADSGLYLEVVMVENQSAGLLKIREVLGAFRRKLGCTRGSKSRTTGFGRRSSPRPIASAISRSRSKKRARSHATPRSCVSGKKARTSIRRGFLRVRRKRSRSRRG